MPEPRSENQRCLQEVLRVSTLLSRLMQRLSNPRILDVAHISLISYLSFSVFSWWISIPSPPLDLSKFQILQHLTDWVLLLALLAAAGPLTAKLIHEQALIKWQNSIKRRNLSIWNLNEIPKDNGIKSLEGLGNNYRVSLLWTSFDCPI